MKCTRWDMASAYVVGRGHTSNGLPCQDRTYELKAKEYASILQKRKRYKHSSAIKRKHFSFFYGLSLADGAGSCEHSDIGAELVCEKVLYFIKSNFDVLLLGHDTDTRILQYLMKILEDAAEEKNIELRSLSSTLLFVAIKNNKYIIGHIGDGVIGMLDKKGKVRTISHPENGEYSNTTYFTTSVNHKGRLKIFKGTLNNAVGFILMSDGTEESLYDKNKRELIEINTTIINWLKDSAPAKVHQALKGNLKQVFTENTVDDCSIGIMRKK